MDSRTASSFPFFTLSHRTRNVWQLHGVRVPDGFLYCKILIGLLILLMFVDPKDDFIMLPGTILRPEGFPKLADLVGHSARVQDTRKAARDLPHNLLKSKAGRCRSRVLVNTSTLQKRNRSFGCELICQSFFYWFDVIWLQVLCSDCVCEPAYGESWEELVEVIEKILAPDGSVLISLRHGRHKGMGCLWRLWLRLSILENLILNTAFSHNIWELFCKLSVISTCRLSGMM